MSVEPKRSVCLFQLNTLKLEGCILQANSPAVTRSVCQGICFLVSCYKKASDYFIGLVTEGCFLSHILSIDVSSDNTVFGDTLGTQVGNRSLLG